MFVSPHHGRRAKGRAVVYATSFLGNNSRSGNNFFSAVSKRQSFASVTRRLSGLFDVVALESFRGECRDCIMGMEGLWFCRSRRTYGMNPVATTNLRPRP